MAQAGDVSRQRQEQRTAPLSGVTIIDMTTVQMGPYATLILADLGANVIKIESPKSGGDISRQSIPARTRGMGQNFRMKRPALA